MKQTCNSELGIGNSEYPIPHSPFPIPHSIAGRAPLSVVLGVVGVVVLAGVAIGPWLQLTRLKQEVAAREQIIATLKTENQELQQQLAQLQAERGELEKRLEGLRGQLTAATQELASLRDIQVRHDALQREKTQLDVELARLTRERSDANERAQRLEEEKRGLERIAARLRNRLALADRDYRQLIERVASLERQLSQGPSDSSSGVTTGFPQPRVEAVWPLTPQTAPISFQRSTLPPAPLNRLTEGDVFQHNAQGPPPSALPRDHPSDAVVPNTLIAQAAELDVHPVTPRKPQPSGRGGMGGDERELLGEAPPFRAGSNGVHPLRDGVEPQTIELPPIVVRKHQAAIGAIIRAQVAEVNPPHRFLVIDQGADDGVREGMTFDVWHEGHVVGRTVAVRVRPRLSACDLISAETSEAIHVGDLAVQRAP